jgi:hypothetical protein
MASRSAFREKVPRSYKLAVVVALATGACTFLWVMLARSWARVEPGEDARPNATLPEKGPNDGLTHVKARSTSGLGTYYVLAGKEDWQRSRAADACEHATNLHRVAVQRYADLSPAQKERSASALDSLPTTLGIKWAEGSDEQHGTFKVERTVSSGTGRYAYVRPGHVSADFAAALSAVFPAQLQRQQVGQLLAGAVQ